ncbi:hypothetical protein [Lactobacillus sp. PV034]|uniref:hypothetical protein n=1 Tax=Lactobacillus sp. PV034 TaxID=2594495 RepID=UPI00223EAF67|nr:hypothetical protein [Lactobacillus sp. PV034]QNQ80212.1 hypothetical protein FP432_00900 [Lactobacillus sp. PV034]
MLAYICSLTELNKIVDEVVIALATIDDDFSLRILTNTLITCLERFYQAGQVKKARIVVEIIQEIPQRSVLVLEHVVGKYYYTLLKGNEDQVHGIKGLLKDTGYEYILSLKPAKD